MHGIQFIPDADKKLSSQSQMLNAHPSEPVFTECAHTLLSVLPSASICLYPMLLHCLIALTNNTDISFTVFLSVMIHFAFVEFLFFLILVH